MTEQNDKLRTIVLGYTAGAGVKYMGLVAGVAGVVQEDLGSGIGGLIAYVCGELVIRGMASRERRMENQALENKINLNLDENND